MVNSSHKSQRNGKVNRSQRKSMTIIKGQLKSHESPSSPFSSARNHISCASRGMLSSSVFHIPFVLSFSFPLPYLNSLQIFKKEFDQISCVHCHCPPWPFSTTHVQSYLQLSSELPPSLRYRPPIQVLPPKVINSTIYHCPPINTHSSQLWT